MASSESGGGGSNSGTKPVRGSGKKAPQQPRQQSPVPRKNSSASDKDEDPVLQSIASMPSILHTPHQVTLTCYIPSQAVGAVIGRRGSTIAQIQRQAQQYGNVRVSIVGHDDTSESIPYTHTQLDWSSADWTPVVMRGDPCAALCAAQRLRDYAGGDLDDVVLDVPLNRGNFSKLIGKRGVVLAGLSADTNVRIMVPQRAMRVDLIQLEGELDNCTVCFGKIVVLLSALKKNSPGEENTVSASITVPTLPSQTKLRVVARKTETSLQKKRQADESWLITVWGKDSDQVDNAVGMLETWKMHNTAAKQTGSSNTTPPKRRPKTQNRNKQKSNKKGVKAGSTPTQSASSPPTEAPKADN